MTMITPGSRPAAVPAWEVVRRVPSHKPGFAAGSKRIGHASGTARFGARVSRVTWRTTSGGNMTTAERYDFFPAVPGARPAPIRAQENLP